MSDNRPVTVSEYGSSCRYSGVCRVRTNLNFGPNYVCRWRGTEEVYLLQNPTCKVQIPDYLPPPPTLLQPLYLVHYIIAVGTMA